MTLQELREKDVIQMQSGENLGRVDDVVFGRKDRVPAGGRAARAGAPVRAVGL